MLSDKILKTLKYFDVQDHCLTLLEIDKYLIEDNSESAAEYSAGEILDCLESQLSREVGQKYGFYFLNGRQILVEQRLRSNFYATPRLKKAARYLKLTRHIPYIRAVALTGSEALSNSRQGSDIDLFIITKSGRIWLGRIFITAFFHLLGMRRYSEKIKDRFCLNHYIIEGKQIGEDQNRYTAVEYVSLIPYFGGAEIHRFQKLNLNWIRKFLHQPKFAQYPTAAGSLFQRSIEFLLNNFIGDFFEKKAAEIQKRRIKIRSNIVVNDTELAFHPGSKGQQVLTKVSF